MTAKQKQELMCGQRVSRGVFRSRKALPQHVAKFGSKDRHKAMLSRARRRQHKMIEELTEIGSNMRLVDGLSACGQVDNRKACWNGLCPRCSMTAAKWLEWTAAVAFKRLLRAADKRFIGGVRDRLGVLSIKIEGLPVDLVDHALLDERWNERVRDLLREAGVPMAIGFIASEGLESGESEFQLRHCLVYHLLIDAADVCPSDLATSMERRLGRGDSHSRRVRLRMLNADPATPLLIDAALKAPNVRRVMELTRKGQNRRRRAKIMKRQMSAEQLTEVKKAFVGAEDRLFLYGAVLQRNKRGRLVIRPTDKAIAKKVKSLKAEEAYDFDFGTLSELE